VVDSVHDELHLFLALNNRMPTFKQELTTTPSSNEKQARLFAQGFAVLDWARASVEAK
jgi:hypothetical protein